MKGGRSGPPPGREGLIGGLGLGPLASVVEGEDQAHGELDRGVRPGRQLRRLEGRVEPLEPLAPDAGRGGQRRLRGRYVSQLRCGRIVQASRSASVAASGGGR